MVVLFRGRNDAMILHALPLYVTSTSPGMPLQARSARQACVLASIIAFIMGIGVGITLPLALARGPNLSRSKEALIFPHALQSRVSLLSATSDSQNRSNDVFIENTTKSVKIITSHNLELLENNIYIGNSIEREIPMGFSNTEVEEWRIFVRKNPVVRLQEGCGRMQNRLLTFANGSKSCCRYRQNFDQIQGEIFSFYLSRLIGTHNVPPSALGVVKTSTKQWSGVGNQLALAQWAEERPVVLTKYIESLGNAFIPLSLRSSSRRRLHPMDVEMQDPKDTKSLVELAQWSDLIIFDYLTANLDRVVNNLYNMQWNPSMMEAPAHNLAQYQPSGLLVFLDNESGLLHGYRLLDKYEPFHSSLLNAVCVFRKRTIMRIVQLVKRGNAGDKLQKMFKSLEPEVLGFLPTIPDKSIKILNERLKKVVKQFRHCEKLYSTA